MSETNLALDADELLHLAIDASQKDDNSGSLSYLKQALTIEPNNAKLHYMLGAIHAEIGMYERAVADMQKAVDLDATLVTAVFQLGLLHITSGNVAEAEKAWASLDQLGEENCLYLFKKGILHLAANEFAECVELLNKGISLNTINPALNKDMQMLIEQAQKAIDSGATSDPGESSSDSASNHVFLSAYHNDDEKPN